MRTDATPIEFIDRIQGQVSCRLDHKVGDFVLKRSDGLFSYQLAVAVDDVLQEITEVVRGYDLLDSTPRQIFLQQQLGYANPGYAHHPVAVDSRGDKLSKRSFAKAIHKKESAMALYQALEFLGQSPPGELQFEPVELIWTWAIEHWQFSNIPQYHSIKTEN